MHRRQLLGRALGLAVAPLTSTIVGHVPAHAATLGTSQPFDFAALKGEARALAQAPYQPPRAGLPDALAHLGYDAFQSIRFRRIHYHTNRDADVAAFLGASYFRAVGSDSRQYGASARGLAIDTGSDHAEEFPDFTAFWFERPGAASGRLTFYASLDSPSVAGAYRFDLFPGAMLTIDVDAALYPRRPIERLGIAPLTSMYLYGENDRRKAEDWRPEIHDSDGLSVRTGTGEWIGRPLTDPAGVHLYSYLDRDPRGFGLLQRDRNLDHYQDDGARYERRPSVWIEPRAADGTHWGEGSVKLLEYAVPPDRHGAAHRDVDVSMGSAAGCGTREAMATARENKVMCAATSRSAPC